MQYRVFQFLLIVGLAALLSLTVLSNRPAYSCSCAPLPSVSQAFQDASAVFSGRVIALETHQGRRYATFAIERRWKGALGSEATVQTPITTAACGYPFEMNQSYLIYGRDRSGLLQTNQCSRTARLSQAADDVAELNTDYPCP